MQPILNKAEQELEDLPLRVGLSTSAEERLMYLADQGRRMEAECSDAIDRLNAFLAGNGSFADVQQARGALVRARSMARAAVQTDPR